MPRAAAVLFVAVFLPSISIGAPFDVRTFRPWPGYKIANGEWLQGDFDGDRKSDLFHQRGSEYIHVWLSKGDGTYTVSAFNPWPGYDTGKGTMHAGDFDRDGRTDILHQVNDYVHVWLSKGDGTFDVKPGFRPRGDTDLGTGRMIVGHVNHDHRADVVHLVYGSDVAHIWRSNGDGTFNTTKFIPWAGYAMGSGEWYAADIDADGLLDLMHAVGGADYVNVWRSQGDSTFSISSFRPWDGYKVDNGPMIVGRVGRSEILHALGSGADYVHPWFSNGDGTFRIFVQRPWAGYPVSSGTWVAANLDSDADSDFVHLVGGGADFVHIWTSRSDGTFAISSFSPWAGYRIDNGPWRSGDVNGDGRDDLIHLVDDEYIHVWLSTVAAPGELALDGIEVTQAIQDMTNIVRLVAGKATTVRVYPAANVTAPIRVRADLLISRDGGGGTLSSSNAVTIDPARNGDLVSKRRSLADSLNFDLPASFTNTGTWKATVRFRRDSDRAPLPCSNCPNSGITATFTAEPPLRVRNLGLEYELNGMKHAPRPLDYALLASWLRRAFPVSELILQQEKIVSGLPAPFTYGQGNTLLASIRANDVAMGFDPRTHYTGMVADSGFFLSTSGSSANAARCDADVVATVATGATQLAFNWDTDGSYGDFLTGHELGHSFGRTHPGVCTFEGLGDSSFPYPKAQISNDDNAFFGFDSGDPAIPIAPAALPGTAWHDLMSYCSYRWPSRYTYEGIRKHLRCENGMPAFAATRAAASAPPNLVTGAASAPAVISATRPPSARPLAASRRAPVATLGAAPPVPPPAQSAPAIPAGDTPPPVERIAVVDLEPSFDEAAARPPALRSGDLLQVVALIDLTAGTGGIRYTNRLPAAVAVPAATERRAAIRFLDRTGKTLAEHFAELMMGTSRGPGDPEVAMVDAKNPFASGTTAIQLVLDGKVLDTWRASPGLPRVHRIGLQEAPHAGDPIILRWSANDPDDDPLSYTILISNDAGKSWRTIATGIRKDPLEIPGASARGAAAITIRVIASDGINRGEMTKTLELGRK